MIGFFSTVVARLGHGGTGVFGARFALAVAFGLSAGLASEAGSTDPSGSIPGPGPGLGDGEEWTSERRVALVEEALAAAERLSMRRDAVDWDALRTEARARAAKARGLDEARDVIDWMLGELGDGHSSLVREGSMAGSDAASASGADAGAAAGAGAGRAGAGGRTMPAPVEPEGRRLTGRIGYLRVPHLIAMAPDVTEPWMRKLDGLQARLAAEGVEAWVVDLRRNVGGNMWPMLAVLSGILGEGKAGTMTMPGGKPRDWGVAPGEVWVGPPPSPMVSLGDAAAPDTSAFPVAVLTDQRTASSGEAVVVSFRGRPRTRSFGMPTSGRSTANSTVALSDGSLLNITTSAFRDRTGRVYGGPIVPDVVFDLPAPARDDPFPGTDGAADPVLEAAVAWLEDELPK